MAKIKIQTERCKGCEYCVIVCPEKIIKMSDKFNCKGVKPAVVVDISACTGCAMCAQMCPEVCIEITQD